MKTTDFFTTSLGRILHADSLEVMRDTIPHQSVDLIVTSPPFGLVRKKSYGNVDANKYVEWFRSFGHEFHRILKPTGSLVIDIGGSWVPGLPTRSLYHFELLIMLCRDIGFHLAQEFFWWSPSKLPTPAEWVTVRRIRVKDAVNCIWWLSPTPWPKASNRRVLSPYSESMKTLLKNGYKAKLRPSGHDISEKFSTDNKASISPNLIAMPNTESNSYYMRYCKDHGLPMHPARFPTELPEFFIRMLTDKNDFVFDPFAGSCVTGEVADRLGRKWLCCDLDELYLKGALGRFKKQYLFDQSSKPKDISYRLSHPAATWGLFQDIPLDPSGGRSRTPLKKPHRSQTPDTPQPAPTIVQDITPKITKPKTRKRIAKGAR